MIELIAIDIDNTITDESGTITAAVVKAVQTAERLKRKIVLVSARPSGGVALAVHALGVSAYRIGYLGAVTQEPLGTELRRLTIDIDIAREIARWADDSRISLTLTIDDTEYHTCGESRASMIPRQIVESAVATLAKGIPPVLIGTIKNAASTALAEYCTSRYTDALHVVRHVNIDGSYMSTLVVNRNADKGTAVLALCEHLAIDKRNVLAVGDSESDAAMFRVAGHSVAVQNGDTAAKAAASVVAPAAYGAGVVWAIREFILGACDEAL
jgi:Cof subfamily protein (haloacid dehalogenase superfamily)